MTQKRIVNLNDLLLTDNGDGAAFVAKIGRAGPTIGSTGLGCTLTVIPPGKRAYPFHRHHVIHELFYVIAGTGEYRLGEKRLKIRSGDLIAAPTGEEAHQIVNSSSEDLRFLAFSTLGEVDIVEYPDTGKMAAAAGIKNADFGTATYKALGHIKPAGYFEGEK